MFEVTNLSRLQRPSGCYSVRLSVDDVRPSCSHWENRTDVPHASAAVLWRIMTLSHDSYTCRAGHPYDESVHPPHCCFYWFRETLFLSPVLETIPPSPVLQIQSPISFTPICRWHWQELNEDNYKTRTVTNHRIKTRK